MAINAGQVFVELGARLDRREFQQYEKHLKDVREQASKKERYKAQLGADFNPRAFAAYERELKKADRQNDSMVKSQGRMRTAFGSVWGKGGAAFAAAGGAYAVVSGVKAIIKASGEAEVSQRKMERQLKTSGISYKAHADEIDKVIQKTSQLSGLDDEDLQDAFTAIVRTTGKVNVGLKDMALVADLARAKHMDVGKAGELVAKVHAGNVGALRRLGIEFTKSTTHVDALKKSHDKYTPAQLAAAKAQDKAADSTKALGLLQDRFKGQAESYGKTQQGSMDRVKVAWENLQETLGKRLAPTITRGANALARFINQMSSGEGAGGRFANGLGRVAKVASGAVGLFQGFARAVRVGFSGTLDVLDKAYGAVSTLFSALSHVPGMKWAKDVARDIDTSREKLRHFKRDLDVGVAARDVEQQIARMRRRTHGSLNDILGDVRSNMRAIRRRLGSDSKEGKEALENNFDAAVTAIRRAMRRGTVSTRAGLGEIRRLMLQELKTLGIDSAQAKGKPLTQDPAAANRAQRYMGGWMGQRGEVGHDTIPALLAPGEAVLNRHQQAVIEGMLGDGFLDRLFAQVNRPHFMAKGGRAIQRFQGGGSVTGGRLGKAQLAALWVRAGGARDMANLMAAIALAESGGQVGIVNRIGASGLWQIHPPEPGVLDPLTNARIAVRKLRTQGLSAWEAYTNGNYRRFLGAGADIPAGAGAGGGLQAVVWEAIKSPRSGLSGLFGDVVQGTLDKVTAGANRRGRALAAAATPTGAPGGGDMTASTRGLVPRVLAALEFARAHGWSGTVTSGFRSFADQTRIWNSGIRPAARPGHSNHERGQAVDVSDVPGFQRAMNMMPPNKRLYARVPNDPIHFSVTGNSRGGFIQRFQGGGIAGRRGGGLKGYQGGPAAGGGGTRLTIKGLRGIQGDRIENLENIEANVEDMRENYTRQDRRYSLSDEILIDETTGAVNEGNVKKRANELLKLLAIRAHILQQLRKMRTILRRVVQTYKTIISRLSRSLRHAKKKERSGIRKQIAHYRAQLSNRQGQLKDLRGDIFDAETDVMEIRAERKEVLGTTAEIRTPDDIASDLSDAGGDAGGDIGGDADTGGDTTEAPPTPLQIAEAAAAEMRTFLAGRQELLTSFGRNFVPTNQVGATFGTPDALTSAAGLRAFGGAGTAGGLGGATVIAHFASSPENAPTFVEQVRFLVGG